MSNTPNTLRARHIAALDVIRRFLGIDDWTDELIAPADLVRDARALVDKAPKPPAPRAAGISVATYLMANKDGTVVDELNGLQWQAQDDGQSRNFKDAEAYCKSLTLAGHSDWRLPKEEELLSLVDRSRYNPAINPELFPKTSSSFYWASSLYAGLRDDYAWGVHFRNGNTRIDSRVNDGFVRAVRSVSPSSPGQ